MDVYELIKKKRDGLELSAEEIDFLISGFVDGRIPDYQMAAFLMAVYFKGMNDRESVDLTTAMAKSGDQVDLSAIKGVKVDKHSTGGIGDCVSLVLAPALGGLLVGPLVWFFAREAKGHGVPEVMAAVALRGGRIRPVVAVVKSLASSLSIGSGGSAGPEAPVVMSGAALGSNIAKYFSLRERQRITLARAFLRNPRILVLDEPTSGLDPAGRRQLLDLLLSLRETGVTLVKEKVVAYLRERGEIPAGVGVVISGAADQLDATREALSANYVVAVIIIYLLLVAIFTHWGYPLLIMTTIPLGVAGGILGLWLFNLGGAWLPLIGMSELHLGFDMIAMLGFLILMGTVVNNPILIVHQAMTNVRDRGMNALDAVRYAVDTRLRPIAMSTLTTVFGLAPLVFLAGEGTELYRGVGVIVMFGLLGTAMVSLTFLPALTVLVLKITKPRQTAKRAPPKDTGL